MVTEGKQRFRVMQASTNQTERAKNESYWPQLWALVSVRGGYTPHSFMTCNPYPLEPGMYWEPVEFETELGLMELMLAVSVARQRAVLRVWDVEQTAWYPGLFLDGQWWPGAKE